ncbi:hypothetical protein F4809DRAFT_25331 [Biscogniauxia mediterranea]|nr:hypothetical protein F4809DRAFT_25331 [Biscogniauxia mediterranea]
MSKRMPNTLLVTSSLLLPTRLPLPGTCTGETRLADQVGRLRAASRISRVSQTRPAVSLSPKSPPLSLLFRVLNYPFPILGCPVFLGDDGAKKQHQEPHLWAISGRWQTPDFDRKGFRVHRVHRLQGLYGFFGESTFNKAVSVALSQYSRPSCCPISPPPPPLPIRSTVSGCGSLDRVECRGQVGDNVNMFIGRDRSVAHMQSFVCISTCV